MKILVVDDEKDITEIVEFLVEDKFPAGTLIILCSSGFAAIKLLEDNLDFDICICDHNMANGMGNDVLKFLIDTASNTKFVLCSTVIPSDMPGAYPPKYVFSNIQKPDIEIGVQKLYELVSENSSNVAPANSDYVRISTNMLLNIGKLPCDVYLRMTDLKYIKCLHQSEVFSQKDKDHYANKSILFLHVKKDEMNNSVSKSIMDSIDKILAKKNIELGERLSIAHSQTIELIKFNGMTPELSAITKENVHKIAVYLVKSPLATNFWKSLNLLGEYPSKLYTLHSMLSTLIIKSMHWYSEPIVFKLTLAAFIQDISLDSIPLLELSDYQEFLDKHDQFSQIERNTFMNHPMRSIEILADFKDAPLDISRILNEQLEMPNGTGIPKKLDSKSISSLSCVSILSGILARSILKLDKGFKLNLFLEDMKKKGYSECNFREPFDIISKF